MRAWELLGVNLPNLAPLTWPLLRPFLGFKAASDVGSSADQLMFGSRLLSVVRRTGSVVVALMALVAGWVSLTTLIFALPGSINACRTGWTRILAAQLDIDHKPCNFVELIPRFHE